jgi:hypothetical protein
VVAAKTELPPLVTANAELPSAALALQPVKSDAATALASKPLPAPAPLLSPQASAAPQATPAATAGAGADEVLPPTKISPFKRAVPTITVRAAAPAPAADAQAMPDALPPATEGEDAASDPTIVAEVQQGLNNLGFLHQQVDGIASEATSKAIRNFEVYFNYDVTGRVTRQLVNLLQQNGADI